MEFVVGSGITAFSDWKLNVRKRMRVLMDVRTDTPQRNNEMTSPVLVRPVQTSLSRAFYSTDSFYQFEAYRSKACF